MTLDEILTALDRAVDQGDTAAMFGLLSLLLLRMERLKTQAKDVTWDEQEEGKGQ